MSEQEKVIGLRGALTPAEADEKMVAEIEKLLERAKAGEVTALAFVGMCVALTNDIDDDWRRN